MKHKTTKLIFFSILFLFWLYNTVWSVYVACRYTPFCEALGCKTAFVRCSQTDGNYNYHVKKPDYLSFTGNLAISEVITAGEKKDRVNIIIWPKGFHHYEVGAGVSYVVYDASGNLTMDGWSMMLNEDMELLETDAHSKEIYEKYKDEIAILYDLAYQKWGILDTD